MRVQLAKMVKRPVISIISQQLFNFENSVNIYSHIMPQLEGCAFGELAFRHGLTRIRHACRRAQTQAAWLQFERRSTVISAHR